MAGEQTKNGRIRLASGAFDAVYRHLTDGVIVRGCDGVILYGNSAAEKAFGRGPGELAGQPLDDLIPADSVKSADGECRVSLPGFELAFHICAESSGAWCESVMQPVVLSDGAEAGILFFTVRAAQSADADNWDSAADGNLLQTIANNVPLGMYVLDADNDFRFLRANRCFAQTFRVDRVGVRGRTAADFLPAPVAEQWRGFSEKTVRDPENTQTFRLFLLDEKGFPQFVHVMEHLHVFSSGRRLILGAVEDITAEAFFHKYESANAEILRKTQQETDMKKVLSIITGIIFREFDSCRMVWMNRDMGEVMDFIRPDMADRIPKLAPEQREKMIAFMRPVLLEKHACAIPDIARVPELASIREECPGYPPCHVAFEIFNQRQYIGTMLIQFMNRMPFPAYNLEPRLMMVDTFAAILYRIREQQNLADSKRLLEQIIDTLPMSFFVKDAGDKFRYTMCNRKFCRMIGRTREEVVGKTDYDIFPAVIADKLTGEHAGAMRSKDLIHADVEEVVPGLGWHVFEKWLLPFRTDQGGKMLVGIAHDVTEERKLHGIEKFKMNILAYFNDNRGDIREFCDYIAGQMLDVLHCDRILLLPQSASSGIRLTNEWTRPGVERIGKHDPNCPIMKQCRERRKEPVLAFEDVETLYTDLPDVVCHAKSALIARVSIKGRFWGGLAAHYTGFKFKFDAADLQLMQAAASLLTMAVERGEAERELQRRERENQLLVDNTIIPVAMFDGSGRLLRCNQPYQKSIATIEREVKPLLLQSILNGSRTSSLQREINGVYWQIDAHGVFDSANKLTYIFMFAVDMTESVTRIRRQEAVNSCMTAILSEADEDIRVIHEVVRIVSNYFAADGGNFVHFKPDGMELLTTWGFEDSDHPFFRVMPKNREYTSTDNEWMSVLEGREITVENDLQNIPIEDPGLAQIVHATRMGTRCSFKLTHGDRVWGAVSLYFKDPWRTFSQDDYDMLGNFQHTANMLLLKYELTQNLKAERDKAISAEKAKSFFFSCVSHDIRTPLNSIIGFSELLQQGGLPQEKVTEYLGNIIFSGNTLMQLINDVLDFASLDAGKLKLYPAMCDFRRLAENVLTIVGDAAHNKALYLKLDAPGEIPWVKIDSQRVSQILFNLIGNAVKFTEKGGVTLHIRFAPDAQAAGGKKTGLLTFSVQDTGIGIDRSHFSDLMQPFVRIRTKTQVVGTGLGLSICNLMSAKMGGKIKIDSEVGVGSTFTVELPRVEYQTEAPAGLEQQSDTGDLPAEFNVSLLLVDDNRLNLKVLEALCRKLGVKNIGAAESGEDALKMMNDTRFDAVLTDVWMPGLSGPELAEEIRRNPAWRHLPVYALTADVEMTKNADPAPFTGILLKPLRTENIADLLQKITSAKP